MAAVFIMPSAMPSLSVFCRNGVTRVTYLAPLQGLSRFSAQRSVSPPTLSRIRSNLGGEGGMHENERRKQDVWSDWAYKTKNRKGRRESEQVINTNTHQFRSIAMKNDC